MNIIENNNLPILVSYLPYIKYLKIDKIKLYKIIDKILNILEKYNNIINYKIIKINDEIIKEIKIKKGIFEDKDKYENDNIIYKPNKISMLRTISYEISINIYLNNNKYIIEFQYLFGHNSIILEEILELELIKNYLYMFTNYTDYTD